jgi:ubiquitin conjugation factor E4 B
LKIYNCFSEFEDFIKYVVIDKANYKYNNFKNALRIKNEKQNVIDFENSEKIDHFVNELLLKAEVKAKEEEINYDDAPDEFLDPLTSILMDDPVILPSNVTVDRITIETQLINNPVDPYSRLPLSKEDLVPNTELKAKIEAYKQSKQKKK